MCDVQCAILAASCCTVNISFARDEVNYSRDTRAQKISLAVKAGGTVRILVLPVHEVHSAKAAGSVHCLHTLHTLRASHSSGSVHAAKT